MGIGFSWKHWRTQPLKKECQRKVDTDLKSVDKNDFASVSNVTWYSLTLTSCSKMESGGKLKELFWFLLQLACALGAPKLSKRMTESLTGKLANILPSQILKTYWGIRLHMDPSYILKTPPLTTTQISGVVKFPNVAFQDKKKGFIFSFASGKTLAFWIKVPKSLLAWM